MNFHKIQKSHLLKLFKEQLLTSLETRFCDLLKNKTIWIATFLDPQYKNTIKKMLSLDEIKEFNNEIIKEMKSFIEKVTEKAKENQNAKKKKLEDKKYIGYKDEFAEEINDISDEELQLTHKVEEEFSDYAAY